MLQGIPHGHFNTGEGLNFCPIPHDERARQELGIELLMDADARGIDTSMVNDLVPIRAGVEPVSDSGDATRADSSVLVWGDFPLRDSNHVLQLVASFARTHIARLVVEIPDYDQRVHQ